MNKKSFWKHTDLQIVQPYITNHVLSQRQHGLLSLKQNIVGIYHLFILLLSVIEAQMKQYFKLTGKGHATLVILREVVCRLWQMSLKYPLCLYQIAHRLTKENTLIGAYITRKEK
ncbi:MAG: hypothetical protein ACFFCW_32600 [Candidatus Hodarchaeota archaeon]